MKKALFLPLLVLVVSSCSDVLEEVPRNFISPVNYYQNEKDAEGAIAGAYASIYLNSDFKNFDEQHTDYKQGRGSFTSISNFDKVIASDQYGRLNTFWSDFYNTINRANIVLGRVPSIEPLNAAKKTRILAEAHFLRAMAYFNLLINFGAVPLRTSEITDVDDAAAPRAPVAQVYDLIISDLLAAEKDLPESVGANTGTASRWAAKMLLARVYLDKREWSKAAEKANEVIESKKYALVAVRQPDDFYKLFATLTSSEDIMSHHSSVNRQMTFINWLHGAGTPYNKGNVFGFTLLPDMSSPLIKNWNDADLRKRFNLYSQYVNANGVTVTLPPSNPWLFKKFIKDPNGNAIYSMPIFRYAEAFLVYAEAAAMAAGSPTSLAVERLNMVRRRAYGFDPNTPSGVDHAGGGNAEGFQNLVLQERAYEFMLENMRWWDLKRTGKAQEAFKAAGKTFINERLLYPIPQTEIDNNPALGPGDQNPGY